MKLDGLDRCGQRHYRDLAHQRHTLEILERDSADTLEQLLLSLLMGIFEKEMESDELGWKERCKTPGTAP